MIEVARGWLKNDPVYLDTETTGIHDRAEIVDICIVSSDGKVLLDSLVKPTCPIPAGSTEIHGISNGMVSTAPTWPQIWEDVAICLAGRFVCIYNADFDIRVMKQSHAQAGLAWARKLYA